MQPRIALVRQLVSRCAELEASGLDAAEAERLAFGELAHVVEPGLYERYIAERSPERRRRHGVYYTPAEIVEAQVRMVAELLPRLGCAQGFDDPRLLVVDPATGSGAYPLAVLKHG